MNEATLVDFLVAPGRDKRLEVLDAVISKLAGAGLPIRVGELIGLIPWYADNHEAGEAARLVFEAVSGN
jgi:hypothetical protein